MRKINLNEVDDDNRKACLALSIYAVEIGELPSIKSSLDQAKHFPDSRSYAVCDSKNQVAGFTQYGIDQHTGYWKIYRLYIDESFQGKKYGEATLTQIIEIISTTHKADKILITYNSNNFVAHQLYLKFGFKEHGREEDKIHAVLIVSTM